MGRQRARVAVKKAIRRLLQCSRPEVVVDSYSVGSADGEKWANLRHLLEVELVRLVDSLDVG